MVSLTIFHVNTHGPSAEDPPIIIVHEPDVIAPWEYLACWRFPILNHSSFLYSAITEEISDTPSDSPLYPPMMYTLSSVDVVAYIAFLKTILTGFENRSIRYNVLTDLQNSMGNLCP